MKRNVYLTMVSLQRARQAFLEAFDWPVLAGSEQLDTVEALGRVTAEPLTARLSAPGYNGAAMDGFAVRAEQTYRASEESPLTLELGQQAHPINTGQPLPPGTDAVVMIEHVQQPAPDQVQLRAAVVPWQHVRRVGEDMVAGEMVLPHHHRLGAPDLAALLTAGVFSVRVLRRPRVAILPTGSELLDWREAQAAPPAPGAIIESNSTLLASLVRESGGEPLVLPRQPDDADTICDALDRALQGDAQLVILNAGVSAGSRDFTRSIVERLGRVLVHGVAAMPGKPTLLGEARGKPVVGSPGYPVSAWVCFDQLVAPALAAMQGQVVPSRPTVPAVPARKLASKLGHEELVRVHLGRVGQRVVATPLKRGAGTITSLTRADGIVHIGAHQEGVDEDETVDATLLQPPEALDRTLVLVGSHDITLDHLADQMRRRAPQLVVSASNLGSMAGLVAIGGQRCHLGGTHLLDPDTGEYNVPFIQRLLPETPVRLVTLAHREQGLLVRPGNPKGINSFADLTRPGVTFVNRQRGSGTRVLLDYNLQRETVDADAIQGYELEELTHMGVAVQVLTGAADAGLGILAAAKALGLDFVPVCSERYDLCIPKAFLDDPRVVVLLETLCSPEFRNTVQGLGGYDVSPMGNTAWETP